MKELVDKIRKMHKETMKKKYRGCYEEHYGRDGLCKEIGSCETELIYQECIKCPYLKIAANEVK